MPNNVVFSRLFGIQQQLMGAYNATAPMTNATKGSEREFLVDLFLSSILPNQYRFGSGDITDSHSTRSGQVDIVVEFPFLPSIPIAGCDKFRLYLAESVACAIEVKSDVANQWEQALETCRKIKDLKRNISSYTKSVSGGSFTSSGGMQSLTGATITGNGSGSGIIIGGNSGIKVAGKSIELDLKIPFFAVGYKGWSTLSTMEQRLKSSEVDGLLNIEKKLYVSGTRYQNESYEGDAALWAFICDLLDAVKELEKVDADPRQYA
ncbi:DUF6602 domain-containing protein [Shewanella colwelliana]|uniref:DUF6602 domain-containing protein n=1 Tax=Shewanella colwelliana TaxID=23 RepID=UPI00299E7B9D|nr:DUF6602 domain-containing protein [Shewanella colwelliana]MDX1282188.1 DUF6602 domain-containing protein [Shewanella colwelliana]